MRTHWMYSRRRTTNKILVSVISTGRRCLFGDTFVILYCCGFTFRLRDDLRPNAATQSSTPWVFTGALFRIHFRAPFRTPFRTPFRAPFRTPSRTPLRTLFRKPFWKPFRTPFRTPFWIYARSIPDGNFSIHCTDDGNLVLIAASCTEYGYEYGSEKV